jgi:hypothetical protein
MIIVKEGEWEAKTSKPCVEYCFSDAYSKDRQTMTMNTMSTLIDQQDRRLEYDGRATSH